MSSESLVGELPTPPRANAEVLLWQGRMRIALAALAGGAGFVLQQLGALRGEGPWLFLVIAGYMATIAAMGWYLRRRGEAGQWIIAATVTADLVFIFCSTVASSPPARFERILILSFFVLHLTESYFGRQLASIALGAVVTSYIGLIAMANRAGADLSWTEELWSVGLFAIASAVFIVQYGSFRRRLEHIV